MSADNTSGMHYPLPYVPLVAGCQKGPHNAAFCFNLVLTASRLIASREPTIRARRQDSGLDRIAPFGLVTSGLYKWKGLLSQQQ